ncbi:MAG: thiamine-phosphate kinase [Guyparkeria sp.]|uniref:thiamine-phosphate kinase n=1 Tax=Guyparkeria sp. TaxID=2035736 RepID=UPI00397B9EE7
MDEFDLIARYFDWPARRPEVALAVGDDAAVIDPPADARLVVTTDMLVAGRHFPLDTSPEAVAHKALAVNLSDLAAMGAEPLGFTLSLGLPETDADWLSRFSSALRRVAERWGCDLVGGDTVGSSVLTLSVTAFGTLPAGKIIARGGARPGDRLAVTGCIGDAALGLMVVQDPAAVPEALGAAARDYLRGRLDRPEPRLAAGRALLGSASAGLDCSDGLLQDVGHLLDASGLGAEIDLSAVPLSPAARDWLDARPEDIDRLITGGDDYELIVALPEGTEVDPELGLTMIGRLVEGPVGGIRERHGRVLPTRRGYTHFPGEE